MPIQENKMRVVNKIPCECGKVYIGETGRSMLERIKEHDPDTRLARTQSYAVSDNTIIRCFRVSDRTLSALGRSYWSRSVLVQTYVKEAIYIRLLSDINRDSGIEISEARMPNIKQYNTHSVPMRTTEGTISSLNNKDRNPPINKTPSENRNAQSSPTTGVLMPTHTLSTPSPYEDQGPVVQKPINANPRLKVNQGVYFYTLRCYSTLIFDKTLD